jgi:hypothetical protein
VAGSSENGDGQSGSIRTEFLTSGTISFSTKALFQAIGHFTRRGMSKNGQD